MSYEITGKLAEKFETNQRTETFKVREFVIEKSENINGRDITNYVKFQCIQDKTAMPDRFNKGDEVKVFFNLRGNRYDRDGKVSYFTNLDAWKMESVKMGTEAAPGDTSYNDMPPAAEIVDDLPF